MRGVNCARSFHSNYDCGGAYSLVSFENMLSTSSPLPRSVRRALEVIHADVGQRHTQIEYQGARGEVLEHRTGLGKAQHVGVFVGGKSQALLGSGIARWLAERQ